MVFIVARNNLCCMMQRVPACSVACALLFNTLCLRVQFERQ